MADEQSFLKAILADPDDDAPRLIYADWLEEHAGTATCRRCRKLDERNPTSPYWTCGACGTTGTVSDGRAERAEFIRVQVALAAHDAIAKGNSSDPMPAGFLLFSKREAFRRREQELLERRGREWSPGELLGLKTYGFLGNGGGHMTDPFDANWSWRRGFVEAISLPAEGWLRHAGRVFDPARPETFVPGTILAAQPVRRVQLTTWPLWGWMPWNEARAAVLVHEGMGFGEAITVREGDMIALELLEHHWPGIAFELPSDADAPPLREGDPVVIDTDGRVRRARAGMAAVLRNVVPPAS